MTSQISDAEQTYDSAGTAAEPEASQLRRGRPTDIAGRMGVLRQAADIADGRLDPAAVAGARSVLARSEERMRLSAEHTVVAVAGATGSGKSSLFNAITGLELAAVGARRPTTANALSCVWGDDGAQPLLEWLGIPKRYQLSHESPLDEVEDEELHGLVLLDLPDHDSTQVSHQVEVDRLVELVDMLVWVVDPQKYADRVLHERYLQALAPHRGVVVLVLNRIDQLTEEELRVCQADLAKLAAADGLEDVRILTTSAITGQGIDDFRALLVQTVREKRAATARLTGDAVRCAERLATECGEARVPQIDPHDTDELIEAFAQAGGVPIVVDAVARSYRGQARRATGWPPLRWLARLRRDPLQRLRARLRKGFRSEAAEVNPEAIRASLPEPTPVQRARVDTAARRVVDSAVDGLTQPWVTSIRQAARARESELGDALDQAIVGTDLGVRVRPGWWKATRWCQLLLFAVLLVGLGWSGAWFGAEVTGMTMPVDTPMWLGLPIPAWAAAGAALLGLLLALLSRAAAQAGARRRAETARTRMVEAIGAVAHRLVVAPVEAELEAYRTCRDALAAVRRR